MRYRQIFVFLVCFILNAGLLWAGSNTAFVPPEGKILLVVGQDPDTIDAYVDSVGIVPGGFMTYTSIQEMQGLDSPGKDYGAGSPYAQGLIEKYPNTVIQIGLYMVNALDGTVQGKYDENIAKFAAWAKQLNIPIYLRIGYEFDLPDNQYDPEKYKQAFRYIVDALRKAEVTNVAYVWHSYGYVRVGSPVMDWYPGDEYVDWFAVSFFDAYHRGDFVHIAHRARENNKPLMIGESTPFGVGTTGGEKSWDRWFKKYFKFIEEQNVKVVSYINSDWESQPMWKGQGWGDARIQQNEFVKKAWLKEIQKDKYIQSHADLFEELDFSQRQRR